MALTAKISTTVNFTQTKVFQGSTASQSPNISFSSNFADGTLKDQGNRLFLEKARSLATASNDDIDLSGALLDIYGDTIIFAKVKGICIVNLSAIIGDVLKIGGDANAFLLFDNATDIYPLGPGGKFEIWEPSLAGRPVTAATADILRINNAGPNTVTFDIAIVGTSV